MQTERPDVLVMSEMRSGAAEALASLRETLPYLRLSGMGDIGIASRWPWELVALPDRPAGQLAVVRLATPVGPVIMIATHPVAPVGPDHAINRDRLIAYIGTLVRRTHEPVILAGDFNATPWSRPMRGLVAGTDLAFGPGAWLATWPVLLPRLLGVPIDHVLGGNGCRPATRRHGTRIGSDHWPIVVEVRCLQPMSG